jgi:hypothetical protein
VRFAKFRLLINAMVRNHHSSASDEYGKIITVIPYSKSDWIRHMKRAVHPERCVEALPNCSPLTFHTESLLGVVAKAKPGILCVDGHFFSMNLNSLTKNFNLFIDEISLSVNIHHHIPMKNY